MRMVDRWQQFADRIRLRPFRLAFRSLLNASAMLANKCVSRNWLASVVIPVYFICFL